MFETVAEWHSPLGFENSDRLPNFYQIECLKLTTSYLYIAIYLYIILLTVTIAHELKEDMYTKVKVVVFWEFPCVDFNHNGNFLSCTQTLFLSPKTRFNVDYEEFLNLSTHRYLT